MCILTKLKWCLLLKYFFSNVIGVHMNTGPLLHLSLSVWVRLWIGEYLPSLIYTPEEIAINVPLKAQLLDALQESGYLHLQATKPDTVGEIFSSVLLINKLFSVRFFHMLCV